MNNSEHHFQSVNEVESSESGGVSEFIESLYRYRWYAISIVVTALTLGVFYASTQKDMYKSISSILVDNSKAQITTYREAAGTMTQDTRGLIETQIVIATSMPVLLGAAQQTDAKTYFGVSSDQQAAVMLQRSTRCYQYKKTNIFYIEAVSADPVWAAKFANAVSDKFIKESLRQSLKGNQDLLKMLPGDAQSDPTTLMEKMTDPYFIESLPSVQQSQTIQDLKKEKLALVGQLGQLRIRYTDQSPMVIETLLKLENTEQQIKEETASIVAGLKRNLTSEFKSANMSVFEQAKPADHPYAPNRPKIILMFGVVGLLLSVFLCRFMGVLVITVNGEEDLARLANMPYLGHLPIIDSKIAKNSGIQDLLNLQAVRDSMAMLHTALIFSMPKDRSKLIMLTSCIPGEGKSSVSALLAYTMAKMGADTAHKHQNTGERVVLIEADIRRPGFSDRVKFVKNDKVHPGLSDYLTGSASFDEIIRKVVDQPNLDVISAGTTSRNPEGLFTSKMFDELIKMCEARYARVIFDSPPFLSIPEAAIISQKMHGTVFVIGCGMLRRKVLLRAIDKFKLLNTTLYGTVLNRLNMNLKTHYQGYKYRTKDDAK